MAEFTKGPWIAKRSQWSRWEIFYNDGQLAVIAKPDDPANPPKSWKECEATARLIAAAPDLYSALKEICEFWAYGMSQPDGANPSTEDLKNVERLGSKAAAALRRAVPNEERGCWILSARCSNPRKAATMKSDFKAENVRRRVREYLEKQPLSELLQIEREYGLGRPRLVLIEGILAADERVLAVIDNDYGLNEPSEEE